MNVLFLGAGKRVSLFERFYEAAMREDVSLRLFSYEDSRKVPVADLSTVVVGRQWSDPGFGAHLLEVVRENMIDAVVPCMDGATVVLSKLRDVGGALPVVSSPAVCATFGDKRAADLWFKTNGVSTPTLTDSSLFPWIAKPAHGFGGKGIVRFRDRAAYEAFARDRKMWKYVVQPVIDGTEYSVDAYVGLDGAVLGCVARERLETANGEVVRTVTRSIPALEDECRRILALDGFRGPITLQAIERDGEFYFLEINPRFGGGVIASIAAGADYPRMVLREARGLKAGPIEPVRENMLMVRSYREAFFDDRG